MKSVYNEGILRVTLPERVDANNANEFEQDLFTVINLENAQEIIIDAENLKYISSLGLRVIMKFQKKFKPTPISAVNVSNDIYNVFDVTGFTAFLNVKKKLRFVDFKPFQMLGVGMYGAVYRINDEQILKVFHGINSEDAIQPMIKIIRTAFVNGIPTIIPFEIVRTEKGMGLILELLNSEMLSTLMKNNPEKLDKYVNDMVELSKILANAPFETGTLRSRNEMLMSKLDNADKFLLPEEIATIKKYINAVPQRNTAVHGDFHAKNIMMMDDKPILIDMDEFSCGHPIWDIGNLYFIYQAVAHADPEMSEDLFGIAGKIPYADFYIKIIGFNFDEADKIWDKFFNGYFADYSQEDKNKILELVEFYGNFKYITFLLDACNITKDNPEKLANNVKHIRNFLAKLEKKNIDELINYLDLWK